jgi:hypothetical protein
MVLTCFYFLHYFVNLILCYLQLLFDLNFEAILVTVLCPVGVCKNEVTYLQSHLQKFLGSNLDTILYLQLAIESLQLGMA